MTPRALARRADAHRKRQEALLRREELANRRTATLCAVIVNTVKGSLVKNWQPVTADDFLGGSEDKVPDPAAEKRKLQAAFPHVKIR